MILIVTFDLKGPHYQKYLQLDRYLKSHKGWMHYIPSTWLIDTEKNPRQVTDAVRKYFQPGDKVLVVPLTTPYSGWLPRRAWEWIKKHISPSTI